MIKELKCWSCKAVFTLTEHGNCDGCCWKCGVEIDLNEMDIPAAPQPPALGGEHETLAWLVRDSRDGQYSAHRHNPAGWAHGYQVSELIDRAHLAPLQAEIERLGKEVSRKTHCYQVERAKLTEKNVEIDQLKARCDELERLVSKATEQETGTVVQRDKFKALLRDLVRDSLASDFNEHWDSYQDAKDALSKPAGSEQV